VQKGGREMTKRVVAALAEKIRAHRAVVERSEDTAWRVSQMLAVHDGVVRMIADAVEGERPGFDRQRFYTACGMREGSSSDRADEDGEGSTRRVPFYGPERVALIEQGWATMWVDGALEARTATMLKVRPIRGNAIPKEGSK